MSHFKYVSKLGIFNWALYINYMVLAIDPFLGRFLPTHMELLCIAFHNISMQPVAAHRVPLSLIVLAGEDPRAAAMGPGAVRRGARERRGGRVDWVGICSGAGTQPILYKSLRHYTMPQLKRIGQSSKGRYKAPPNHTKPKNIPQSSTRLDKTRKQWTVTQIY